MARRWKLFFAASLCGALLASGVGVAPSASALNGRLVYGVSPYCNGPQSDGCQDDDYGLQAFDATTGGLAGPGKIIDVIAGPDNTANLHVQNAQGLTIDPTTGDAWAVLRFGDFGSQVRYLATIDLDTAQATTIGRLIDTASKPQRIASITFSSAGVLYAVSGDGANIGTSDCAECLYTVNLATAALTKVATLGNGGTGEAIAFNTDDGLIYHASGRPGSPPSGPAVFESIDPANAFAITNIPLSGDTTNEINGMVYDPAQVAFLVTDGSQDVSTIALNGFVDDISEIDEYLRGLVLADREDSVAIDDEAFVQSDSTNNVLDVLDNDIPGTVNPALVVQTVSDPPHGTTAVSVGGGSVTYSPETGYCTEAGGGPDTFTYTLTTGAVATVRVRITCPSFDESLTLRYAKATRTFKGDITSDEPACLDERSIDIYKTSPQTGETFVGSATTDNAGHYELKQKVGKGRYFARLYSASITGRGFCSEADSPQIRVRR